MEKHNDLFISEIPQEINDKCIDRFKPRLRRVIGLDTGHIEQYMYSSNISKYAILKIGMILIN